MSRQSKKWRALVPTAVACALFLVAAAVVRERRRGDRRMRGRCTEDVSALLASLVSRKGLDEPAKDLSVLPVSLRWHGRGVFNPSLVAESAERVLTVRPTP